MAWPARKTPTTPTPSQYTDYDSVDIANDNAPPAANDNYQTVSQRFTAVRRTQGRTNPTRENIEAAERERRIAQKQEALEEFRAIAAYQESLSVAQAQEFATVAELESNDRNSPTKNLATDIATAAKNTPAAIWMTAWHTWFWLTFQLPLAFISLAFIGLQAAIDGTWVGQILQRAMGVINAAANFLGGDLSLLAPLNIALAMHFLVFGLSILCLLVTIMIYAVRGQNPFGGDRMTGKFGALLLCFIGYSSPLLNLFPWIGLYIYVMWRSKS